MKADLCDRCGERIYPSNPAHKDRALTRVYIEHQDYPGRWWDFHTSCAENMTITDILNGGTA